MADFVINGVSTTARTLVGTESGFITSGSGLVVNGSDAVTVTTGTNWLHVLGDLYAFNGGFAAVDAGGSVFEMVVGAQGYVSAENPTGGVLDIDVSTHFSLDNHGIIHSSNDDAINFADSDGAANIFLRNFGTISARDEDAVNVNVGLGAYNIENYGTITAHRIGLNLTSSSTSSTSNVVHNYGTVQTMFEAAIDLNGGGEFQLTEIINTGEIFGSTGGIDYSGAGRVSLFNTGTIAVENAGDRAVNLSAGNDEIVNSGQIQGSVFVREGNNKITNTGEIIGRISAGAGNDELLNAGEIVGNVSLGDGANLYDGREGSLIGSVESGVNNDTIMTSDQDDSVNSGAGNDQIKTYGGDDLIQSGDNNDNIYAGEGNDEVLAGTGNDMVRGGLGDDDLNGGSGRDTVRGGSGNDTILGGRDADELSGGAGEDVFIYTNANQSTVANRDTITDFMRGSDQIDVSTFGATFIGNAGFSGGGVAELRYGTGGGNTRFEIDVDGNGTADMRVDMGSIGGLAEDDFIL